MPSVHCIVFALALLAGCNPLASSVVVGPNKLDESRSDVDGLNLFLGDEASDDLVTPKRFAVQDNRVGEEEGATRIIIISVSVGVCVCVCAFAVRSVLNEMIRVTHTYTRWSEEY